MFVWEGGNKKVHKTDDPALPGTEGTFPTKCGKTVTGTIESEQVAELCRQCERT